MRWCQIYGQYQVTRKFRYWNQYQEGKNGTETFLPNGIQDLGFHILQLKDFGAG